MDRQPSISGVSFKREGVTGGFIDLLMAQIQQDRHFLGVEKLLNFWTGKVPCWTLLDCSKYVYPKCPAYLHPEAPCWNHVCTESEKLLHIRRDCKCCKVFNIYGEQAPGAPVTSPKSKIPSK